MYTERLKDIIDTPVIADYNSTAWAQYTVRNSNRDNIRDYLASNNIPTAVHYPVPLHKQQAFSYLNNNTSCAVAENLSNNVFSLPMHPFLKENEN